MFGRVQGVFYRGTVAERARALALRGIARNHTDGRVEVRVVGDEAAVQQLLEFLWIGPSAARVTRVEVEPIDPEENEWPQGFVTG